MSPCLDFPRSCDILFLAGAFSVLSRVLSVRCRAVARGRLLFLRHIKTVRTGLRAGGCSVSKKPRRVCRPQAAKKCNHFLSRHVRERKYCSGCKCGICASQAHKFCAQQTATPLSENPPGFSTVLNRPHGSPCGRKCCLCSYYA